jgi:DNA-binding NtrC family response regulator
MAKCKVLLVDDEEEFVIALAERLIMRNLDARVAHSGEQALYMIVDEPPDVMLLDLKMPGMDGLEVLRRIKRSHAQIKVVILTGHGSHKDAEIAQRLGAFGYLQKPSAIEEIVQTLTRAYQQKLVDSAVPI